jgi:hypothetical protein
MNISRKFNPKLIASFTALAMLLIVTLPAIGNYKNKKFFYNSLTASLDTVPAHVRANTRRTARSNSTDTVPKPVSARDSSNLPDSANKDTIPQSRADTLNVKISKDSLDAPIDYSASDSVVLEVPTKKIILYNKAEVKQKDLDLTAYKIELDQPRKLVVATYTRDTAGRIIGLPNLIQEGNNMTADTIVYNIQSQKGITKNTNMTSGEIFFYNEQAKKISKNEFFALRGRFTTCDLDTPHFAFRTKKMKLINQKMAVSGPIHPEFEGVPIPIYIPFGYFPISQGRHSGILVPTFTASEQYGLGLENGGYYKVLNDNFDVTLRGNVYSYGGWALFVNPTYRVRYRFQGALNFAMQNARFLTEDPKEPFKSTKTFNITWSHSQDTKARPGTTFSASVNAGSTQYNKYVSNNAARNYANNLTSSITYSKTWDHYNLTVSANHQQNSVSRLVTLNLPSIGFTATTIYPFQRKEMVGEPKWYEKLGVGLTSNIIGDASFYDSLFSFRHLLDTFTWGAQHQIPIQLSLPQLGPVQISPGISLQQRWYGKKFYRTWDSAKNKVDSSYAKGFFLANDVSFGVSLSTAIFGKFENFGPNSKIRGIRHVIRPTVGINFKPDLASHDYYNLRIDSAGHTARFSVFDGVYPGAFSEGRFGGLNFGLDNNVEMKVRSKKDTTNGGIKKIRILDGLSFNGSYNFFADSFKLSQFTISARSTLFDKINITASTVLDPYQVDSFGIRKDRYMWQDGHHSLGRATNGNVAISTSFQSKPKEKPKTPAHEDESGLLPMTMEEQQAQLQYIRQNPAEFADFNIPWSINLSYSFSFNRQFKTDYSGFETKTYSSMNWNGDFNLTPKWKVGVNGSYDITTSSIQYVTMYLSREMHCWQMSINVTPVGLNRSFNITINPRSSLLRDLRVNRTRYFTSF